MQEAMEELVPHDNNADDDNDEDDMGQPMDGDNVGVADPIQHQDSTTFDQSGSTTQYLRAHGPDIHLTVEMVLQDQVGSTSSSATSSSDSSVSSVHQVVLDITNTSDTTTPLLSIFPVWSLQFRII